MKKSSLILVFLICLLFLFFTSLSFGATYYVATTGDDNSADPTNPATPVATFTKAATLATTAGDIVYIASGTYREAGTVTVTGVGTNINPIRWIGQDPSNQPVLDGSDDLSGYTWTQPDAVGAPNVWATTVTGINSDAGWWDNTGGNTYRVPMSSTLAAVNATARNFWINGTTLNVHMINHASPSGQANSYSKRSPVLRISTDGKNFNEFYNIIFVRGNGRAASTNANVNISGIITGIKFVNCSFVSSNFDGLRLRNGATNCEVRNCTISHNFETGIRLFDTANSTTNNYIISNTFYGNWANNIRIEASATNNIIENNIMSCSQVSIDGGACNSGIDLTYASDGTKINNNTIYLSNSGIISDSVASTASIYNNILDQNANGNINIFDASSAISKSNYNFFSGTASPKVARWQASDKDTLATWQSASGVDYTSIFGSSGLKDPANQDFTVKADAPIFGIGTCINGRKKGILGEADIGTKTYDVFAPINSQRIQSESMIWGN